MFFCGGEAMLLDRGPIIRAYFHAVVLVAAAIAVKLAVVDPIMGRTNAVIFLVWPITIAAYMGGGGPGMLATVLSILGAILVLPPTGLFRVTDPHDWLRIVGLAVQGCISSYCMWSLHWERRRSWRLAEQLQEELHKHDPVVRRIRATDPKERLD